MFVSWDKPRKWSVKLFQPGKGGYRGGMHYTLGILANSLDRAIEAAQNTYPEARIESANDLGAIDIVVDLPCVDVTNV